MAGIRHTDWDVSERHAEIIRSNWPEGVSIRKPQLLKKIPGVTGKRFTETVKSGVWLKPLGSQPGRTFSSVRDVVRKTLLVFVSGSSTRQSQSETEYELVRDKVRDLFQDRRVTDLNGELYSYTSMGDYDIDDVVSRKYDIDIIEISTVFREDRA
jgi:hypothetical protein